MTDEPSSPMQLLSATRAGDEQARQRLTPLVYRELRAVAESKMRGERRNHTLQPTALVNEALLRLLGHMPVDTHTTQQFQALAAAAMRHVLIDHARRRDAAKRDGGERLTLHTDAAVLPGQDIDLLALEEALTHLAALDERQARIVELRFFGGLTAAQVADELGVSLRTVQDDWAMARAWLKRELSRGDTR